MNARDIITKYQLYIKQDNYTICGVVAPDPEPLAYVKANGAEIRRVIREIEAEKKAVYEAAAKKERNYDKVINEGGEGYNPYR